MKDALFRWINRAVYGDRLHVTLPGGKIVTIHVTGVSTDNVERLDLTSQEQPDDFQQFMDRLYRGEA